MKLKFSLRFWSAVFISILTLQACSAQEPVVTMTVPSTNTSEAPNPTSTITPLSASAPNASSALRPTRTPNVAATKNAEAWKTSQAEQVGKPKSTQTPKPTRTPNLAATQQIAEWNAEAQKYFELGYLRTNEGTFIEYDDFSEEWAQLGWYQRYPFDAYQVSDFYMSGHLKWSSAYRSADISGCGFIFAEQENGDHYAVFLDRSKVLFTQTEYYYYPVGTTRGTGRVNFGNPFDQPVEADFTLIVNDAYAYVLVDGEVVGEYTLSQSKILRGKVGLAILSGTNKDFGTRCEVTNLHLWIPNE